MQVSRPKVVIVARGMNSGDRNCNLNFFEETLAKREEQ